MSDAALIDGMEWDPGGIEEGTAEAEDAKIALASYQRNFGARWFGRGGGRRVRGIPALALRHAAQHRAWRCANAGTRNRGI